LPCAGRVAVVEAGEIVEVQDRFNGAAIAVGPRVAHREVVVEALIVHGVVLKVPVAVAVAAAERDDMIVAGHEQAGLGNNLGNRVQVVRVIAPGLNLAVVPNRETGRMARGDLPVPTNGSSGLLTGRYSRSS
jgi:hypothetical protein